MKRGLRKLCDVPARHKETQRDLGKTLSRAGIRFETYWHWNRDRKEDFLRYAVNTRDIPAARDLLPLELRGFRAVGVAAAHGATVRRR